MQRLDYASIIGEVNPPKVGTDQVRATLSPPQAGPGSSRSDTCQQLFEACLAHHRHTEGLGLAALGTGLVAYYNGGLRIVDVSGELLGDLYDQGREIAYWLPQDPEGYVKNAPYTWGPQPFKGHVFISDMNSGLWALRLGDRVTERTTLLEDR